MFRYFGNKLPVQEFLWKTLRKKVFGEIAKHDNKKLILHKNFRRNENVN
jgi:hypothetical protein